MDPRDIKDKWLNQALSSAGIDRSCWTPARGVSENTRIIEAVYDYYGQLFTKNPHLQWAGMANIIGPAFYAGVIDLGFLPDAVRRAIARVLGRASRRLATRLAGDLGFHTTTFLTMQKKIFEDLATMHEAYITADAATLHAWKQIDDGYRVGNIALIDSGNRTLLLREQYEILDRFYVRMLQQLPPLGATFTYLLTLTGSPSVPGAQSYPERYPLSLIARVRGIIISLKTPLADGNIAIFPDRWKLIESDTLPGYLAFIRDQRARALAVIATPIAKRMLEYRLLARAGKLVGAIFTGWSFSLARAVPKTTAGVGSKAFVIPAKQMTVVDLTRVPTRKTVAFEDQIDRRIWMNRNRKPFAMMVLLPNNRAYRGLTEMAIMLSSARGADPDRLELRLPPSGLDSTETLLAQYSREWNFPSDAIHAWRSRCENRKLGDREFSTHVFTPGSVGFVYLEFDVSHHVKEDYFVIDVLFSWNIDVRNAGEPLFEKRDN